MIETPNQFELVNMLKQQERIISQLVEIIAHTNQKVKNLQDKMLQLENNY